MRSVPEVYDKHFKPESSPSNWEVWSWFFMRISGIVLLFLVGGHMAIMHVFGGGVEQIDFEFVAKRWDGVFWRSYDFLLLTLAMLHGANGARMVVEDHFRKAGWRAVLKTSLYVLTFVFYAIGSIVIFTFDASQMPGGG